MKLVGLVGCKFVILHKNCINFIQLFDLFDLTKVSEEPPFEINRLFTDSTKIQIGLFIYFLF